MVQKTSRSGLFGILTIVILIAAIIGTFLMIKPDEIPTTEETALKDTPGEAKPTSGKVTLIPPAAPT